MLQRRMQKKECIKKYIWMMLVFSLTLLLLPIRANAAEEKFRIYYWVLDENGKAYQSGGYEPGVFDPIDMLPSHVATNAYGAALIRCQVSPNDTYSYYPSARDEADHKYEVQGESAPNMHLTKTNTIVKIRLALLDSGQKTTFTYIEPGDPAYPANPLNPLGDTDTYVTIHGRVCDNNGGIAGAVVMVGNPSKPGSELTATTDVDGFYSIPQVGKADFGVIWITAKDSSTGQVIKTVDGKEQHGVIFTDVDQSKSYDFGVNLGAYLTVTVENGDTTTKHPKKDDTVTITADDIQGKTFVNWTSGDGVAFVDSNAAETTFTMPDKSVTVTANYKDNPVVPAEHTVTAVNGTANPASAVAGAQINITADNVEGKTFANWSSSPDGVAFADSTASPTTFTMPDSDVTVAANYEGESIYFVHTVNGTADPAAAAAGTRIAITADSMEGKTFINWTSEDGVDFEDSSAAATEFLMLDKAVTVTANYKDESMDPDNPNPPDPDDPNPPDPDQPSVPDMPREDAVQQEVHRETEEERAQRLEREWKASSQNPENYLTSIQGADGEMKWSGVPTQNYCEETILIVNQPLAEAEVSFEKSDAGNQIVVKLTKNNGGTEMKALLEKTAADNKGTLKEIYDISAQERTKKDYLLVRSIDTVEGMVLYQFALPADLKKAVQEGKTLKLIGCNKAGEIEIFTDTDIDETTFSFATKNPSGTFAFMIL